MSSIVILDNVLHEDSFADVQSDLISKLNGSTNEEWCLLNTEHKFKDFCLALIKLSGTYFNLSPCGGYEYWLHENTKPPTWHIDCDESMKRESDCMSFPLCSIVYYIKVDNLVGGKLHISHSDEVKSGDTYEKFKLIQSSHTDNYSSDIIEPRTNRMVIFPPGKFHMVDDFTGTRISIVINPWDITRYKYPEVYERNY